MKPFVKWAGGKRLLLPHILEIIEIFATTSGHKYTFYEPFVGGGAVFLALNHLPCVINDVNKELISAYHTVRDCPDELMRLLDTHKKNYINNPEEYYYQVRQIDRERVDYIESSTVVAARTIFLNKTCYNGLYRVNSLGYFNTPRGRYKNPTMYEKNNLSAISSFLKKDVSIHSDDFSVCLKEVKYGDIIYVDPPYDYGDHAGFTKYQKEGFSFEDFKRMKTVLDECIQKNAFVIISNNATKRVIDLFEEDPNYQVLYDYKLIDTLRSINSKGHQRKTGKEIIIMGIPQVFPQADSIEKIIKLIRHGDSELMNDVYRLKDFLGVTTYRQVQYYLMALRYLDIINHKKELSPICVQLKDMKLPDLKKGLAELILQKDVFKQVYEAETEDNEQMSQLEIALFIHEYFPNYSDSTRARRSKTIRKWLDWSYLQLSKNINKR